MAPGARERVPGPPELPADIWDYICSYLSKPSLFCLRLTSRSLNDIARRWAYRSLRLEVFGTSAERFAEVALRPDLRALVRELTIDSWPGPSGEYDSKREYDEPDAFLNNLPYLRCFSGLTALHLRFKEFCGQDENCRCARETKGMRCRLLDTVCRCVAGMWTRERQAEMDREMQEDMGTLEWEPRYPSPDEDARLSLGQAMHLRELTIANLGDYHEPRMSTAWEKVLALPSLVDVKLLVGSQCINRLRDSMTVIKERHEFCDNLPRTCLSPAVTGKLRVLSVFYREYWGWFPKVDLRGVELPHLRVLALGNYVFSHEWQIDWFATLGAANSSGGIEELYLDDCPVLFRARQKEPFGSEDSGYPIPEVVLGPSYDLATRKFPLRWHHILLRWAKSMTGLRVFRMGRGTWSDGPADTYKALDRDRDFADVDQEVRWYRAFHTLHRDFACPAPLSSRLIDRARYREEREAVWKAGRHLHGTGMRYDRGFRMQYLEYDVSVAPDPYIETADSVYLGTSDDEPFQPEEGTAGEDDAAYEVLMAAIEARAGLGLERLSMQDS